MFDPNYQSQNYTPEEIQAQIEIAWAIHLDYPEADYEDDDIPDASGYDDELELGYEE